jgi:NitT/TauT family transport system substrate-binding protein
VGILPSPGAAPLLVALGKEYFSQQGLDVDVRYFDSGKVALNTMFAENNLDIVVVAQTPIVAASFDRQDFAIVSGLSSSLNDVKILVRNDRNIQSVEGLRDKRIGVTKGTTGHYFLGLVLAQNNLDFGDIRMMDFPASELADALYSGQVDAISAWEPYIYNAQKKLEENASLLNTENTFRTDYYLVSPKDWIEKNPEVLQRFLKAVDEANIFIAQYPKESQDIIVASINLEPQLIRSIWNDYVYALFLDQAIVLSLEQQSRWIVASKIIQKNIPANYLNFISSEALQVLKKTAVTIIQ